MTAAPDAAALSPTPFGALRATYVEAWGAGWRRLACPYATVPLAADEARALRVRTLAAWRAAEAAARSGAGWPAHPDPAAVRGGPLGALAARLEGPVAAHAGGAFVRLGSRSPKDAPAAALGAMRVGSGHEAVALLAGGSARVARDLALAARHGHTPHVVVRAWRPVPAWAEVRCFVRAGRLVGASACRGIGVAWPPGVDRAAACEALARFAAEFSAASPLPDVVAEVELEPGPDGVMRAWLLDVNPFGPGTDAGHFTWAGGGDFDGSFRLW